MTHTCGHHQHQQRLQVAGRAWSRSCARVALPRVAHYWRLPSRRTLRSSRLVASRAWSRSFARAAPPRVVLTAPRNCGHAPQRMVLMTYTRVCRTPQLKGTFPSTLAHHSNSYCSGPIRAPKQLKGTLPPCSTLHRALWALRLQQGKRWLIGCCCPLG